MKILVTGTSGFIGTSFCERFARSRQFEVVGVDRAAPSESFAGVEYHTIDLTDRRAVRGLVSAVSPEAIFHLAAQARVEPSMARASPTYYDNVLATVNLLDAVESPGPGLDRFVYASSETVYGRADSYPSREEDRPNPQSPYAASKAACELLVSAALRGKALVLRSGMGYGPRSDPRAQVVARFATRALEGRPILFPKGLAPDRHPTRDLNHVQNFLDGVELALRSGASGTYNVASGREVSILTLAERVVAEVGSGSISFVDDFRYREGEEGLRTWLSIEKARDAFGYRPRVTLDEGLAATVDWYRSHRQFFAPVAPAR